jgi:hypothetical protein
MQHNSQPSYVYTDQVQEIMPVRLSCTLDAFGYILLSLKSTKVCLALVYFALISEMLDKKNLLGSECILHGLNDHFSILTSVYYFEVSEIFRW